MLYFSFYILTIEKGDERLMSINELTNEASERICKHMNQDHEEAIISYALHYGGCNKPTQARMLRITNKNMELDVDGELIVINFDHTLKNSKDAHQTLVKMLKDLPNRSFYYVRTQ